jgi:hypothetical protein
MSITVQYAALPILEHNRNEVVDILDEGYRPAQVVLLIHV